MSNVCHDAKTSHDQISRQIVLKKKSADESFSMEKATAKIIVTISNPRLENERRASESWPFCYDLKTT